MTNIQHPGQGLILDAPGLKIILEWGMWGIVNVHVNKPVLFNLLEDFFESKTIDECERSFYVVEEFAPRLSQHFDLSESKANAKFRNPLLKVCTDQLKRLSKTCNASFCGRILMFLATAFPLSDRSGINVKGDYNTVNPTTYEKEREGVMEDVDQQPVDFQLYQTFWGLQQYLQSPSTYIFAPNDPVASNAARWNTFVTGMDPVLGALAAYVPDTQAPSSSASSSSSSSSSAAAASSSSSSSSSTTLSDATLSEPSHYFTKFLTSSNLMNLELNDPYFKRHLLVQMAIHLHALTVFAANPPASTQRTPPVSQAQRTQMADIAERVATIMARIPPNGAQFAKSVRDIITNENNWVAWKREGCKPFERGVTQTISIKRKAPMATAATSNTGDGVPKKRVQMGNATLNRLWNLKNAEEYLTDGGSCFVPKVEDFLRPLETQMHIEKRKAEGHPPDDYDEFDPTAKEIMASETFSWKAMRLASRANFEMFGAMCHGSQTFSFENALRAMHNEQTPSTKAGPLAGSGLLTASPMATPTPLSPAMEPIALDRQHPETQ
eukprot:TRINITY_DN4705_c0_g1_i4.p1 TRINITY_DN4705_c0_g1~~TRINITY_DN4705_c0_g1_i4.p1  ORF type:complete len:620 (+),score=180.70 TRINITY_DN4705_c0_g1_i4:206-1861(+)